MNTSHDLRALGARTDEPPFGFAEFEHRRAALAQRRRVTTWSTVAAVGVLGLVSLLAVITRIPPPATAVAPSVLAQSASTAGADEPPALVDLSQFEITSELEDHIALLDAQISAARVYAQPAERLQQLEATREQLNASLQRVSYAHSLMSL